MLMHCLSVTVYLQRERSGDKGTLVNLLLSLRLAARYTITVISSKDNKMRQRE